MAHKLVVEFDERVDALFDRVRGNPVADRVFYTASALGEFGLIWVVFALFPRFVVGGSTRRRLGGRSSRPVSNRFSSTW